MTSVRPPLPSPVRVVLDAMGGDYAPVETVKGAVEAVQQQDVAVLLVGDRDVVEAELAKYDVKARPITVVRSAGKIGDDEHPVQAIRQKPQASVIVASQLLKAGKADVLVSMGSTGASMASAVMALGLMEGLDRPCIGGPFLGPLAPNTVLVDLGSNIDCRPPLLLSFAVLGSVFADKFLGVPNPRVGLLSVGAEAGKGNRQVQESYQLLQESHLNFIGNVEGMDFFTNRADVIVCDGFVGNILLKYTEGLGGALMQQLGQRLSQVLSSEDLRQVSADLWHMTNRARSTGGPLFGVNGPVILGHGSSKAQGVAGAIATGVRYVEVGLLDSMRQELAQVHRGQTESPSPANPPVSPENPPVLPSS